MLILLILNLTFSNYDFTRLKTTKVIDSYKGISSYTIILLNTGSFYEEINQNINYEIFTTTDQLIKELGLKNIFLSSFNIEQYNFYNLKSEIEESIEISKKLSKNELRKTNKEINKELRKSRKILKKDICSEDRKEYIELLLALKDELAVLKNIRNRDNKKLAKDLNYVELIQLNNLASNLDLINVEFTEDKYLFEYLLEVISLINEFNIDPEVSYLIFKEFSNSKLSVYKDLYKKSEISGKQYAYYENINKLELAITESIFDTFIEYNFSTNEELIAISYLYLVSTVEDLLNSFIKQIASYQNTNPSEYVQLFVNNFFLAPGNRSLPSLLKENRISYVLLSTKATPYFNYKILDIERTCFLTE